MFKKQKKNLFERCTAIPLKCRVFSRNLRHPQFHRHLADWTGMLSRMLWVIVRCWQNRWKSRKRANQSNKSRWFLFITILWHISFVSSYGYFRLYNISFFPFHPAGSRDFGQCGSSEGEQDDLFVHRARQWAVHHREERFQVHALPSSV